MAPKIHV